MSFNGFIQYIQTPDGIIQVISVAILLVTSLMADWIPGFKELSMRSKRLVFLIGCPALPVAATLVLGTVTVESVFTALMSGFLAYWSTQGRNTADNWNKAAWAQTGGDACS